MSEVTEQPPVDVDLSAVAHKVKRHRSRVRSAAVVGSVVAVALVVAVPVLGRSRGGTEAAGPSPTPAAAPIVVPDASWGNDTWNGVSWRTPPGWLRSAAYPGHPRPSNAHIEGPYIGTARLPVTGPTPRPLQGTGVLGSAGPTLAPNAVVAWFTYGQRDEDGFTSDFSATPAYLKEQCTAMGAPYVFHQARQFGTATHGSNLSLDGCISAANPDLFRAQLAAILATATDSAYQGQAHSRCPERDAHPNRLSPGYRRGFGEDGRAAVPIGARHGRERDVRDGGRGTRLRHRPFTQVGAARVRRHRGH